MTDIPVNEGDGRTQVTVTDAGDYTYDYDFRCDASEDMTVYLNADLVDGAYVTVGGLGVATGGTITLDSGNVTLAVDDVITMERSIAIARPNDYQVGGDFKAETINAEMDDIYLILQELRRDIDRGVRLAPFELDTISPLLPTPVADRLLKFNADGTALALGPTTTDVEAIAASLDDIVTVSDNIASVVTTAGSIANVNTVAGSIANVNTVGAAIANVNTVSTNMADVTTVADNVADVVICADNIAAIIDAPNQATSAAASAAAAASSAAEGLYQNVVTLTNADSPFVPTLAQEGTLFKLDMTGGAIIINLSTLATYGEDMKFAFVKIDASGNNATINRGGTDTINGGTSVTLSLLYETHVLIGDSADGEWIDTIQATGIPDGSVVTSKIADSAVTTVKISDSAITTAKINNSAVTEIKIVNGAISFLKLKSDNFISSLSEVLTTATDKIARISDLFDYVQQEKTHSKLETVTIDNDTTIDIDLPDGYSEFELKIKDIMPQNNNVSLEILTSQDGTSFDTGASDYGWVFQGAVTSTTTSSNTFDALMRVCATVSSLGLGNGVNSSAYINTKIKGAKNMSPTFFDNEINYSGANIIMGRSTGVRYESDFVDAIRLQLSSGDIVSGTIELWGIK